LNFGVLVVVVRQGLEALLPQHVMVVLVEAVVL
jgi:hypothetical protein